MAIFCATVYIPRGQLALSCSLSPIMNKDKVRYYGRFLMAPLWSAPDSAIKIIWDEPKPRKNMYDKPMYDKNHNRVYYYPNQETRERILGYLQAAADKNTPRGQEPRVITYADVDKDVKQRIRRLSVNKLSNILIGKNDKYKGRILLEFRDKSFYKDVLDKPPTDLDKFYIKIVTDVSVLAEEGLVDFFYDDWRKSYDEWNATQDKPEEPISREAFFKDNHVKMRSTQDDDEDEEYYRYEMEDLEEDFKEQCKNQSEWTVISLHDGRNDNDAFLQTGNLRY